MEDIFGNNEVMKLLPNEPVIVSIYADGVNVDKRLCLNMSQIPHQVIGCCCHMSDTNFINYEDDVVHTGVNTFNMGDGVTVNMTVRHANPY